MNFFVYILFSNIAQVITFLNYAVEFHIFEISATCNRCIISCNPRYDIRALLVLKLTRRFKSGINFYNLTRERILGVNWSVCKMNRLFLIRIAKITDI